MTMSRAMPESIDWPRTPRPRRRGRRCLVILAAVVAVVLACRTALSYYVEALWFGSLGYRDVFWKTQGVQWAIFAAFAATTFLILYGSFLALKRAHSTELRSGQTIFIAGQEVRLPVEPVLNFSFSASSLAMAFPLAAGLLPECPISPSIWHPPAA